MSLGASSVMFRGSGTVSQKMNDYFGALPKLGGPVCSKIDVFFKSKRPLILPPLGFMILHCAFFAKNRKYA